MKGKTITGKRDPRITPLGAFLRNSKIDEFPQLFNILKGDMSLVGPRPLMYDPDFVSYPPEVQEVVYNVRPGVTAIGSVVFRDEAQLISQVKEEGGDAAAFKQKVIFPYKGQLEVWYNKNQSFWVDLKILMLTAWTIIFPTSQLAFKSFKGLPERGERLKVEFDRMSELKESITLASLIIAVLIPLVPPPFWFYNNWHFILMSFVPVLCFSYMLIGKDKLLIGAVRSDIGWFVFLGLGFLSYFWSTNGAMVWYPAFGWLSLIFWMLLMRSISLRQRFMSIMPLLFCIFFMLVMFQHIVALFFSVPTDANWYFLFGKNANYTSSFLVGFYPYLLFFPSENRIFKIVRLVLSVFVLLILYVTAAWWAWLALFFVGLFYLGDVLHKTHFIKLVLGVLVAAIIVVGYSVKQGAFIDAPVLADIDTLSQTFRAYLFKISLMAFTDAPFFGVGLGNWHLNVYKYDLTNAPTFNNVFEFVRYRSHNLFTGHLVELGIVGLLAFLYPILAAMKRGWRYYGQLSMFQKGAFASLLAYLITSIFYCDVNFHEYHFSIIQLLAFCAIGILTNNTTGYYSTNKYIRGLFFILAVCSFGWFVYAQENFKNYESAQMTIRRNEPIQAIQQLESIYHPIFKTNHDYQTSITLDLAKLYEEVKLYDLAETYFQKAFKQAPYDGNVLINYARFLTSVKKDYTNAKSLVQRIHEIQGNNKEVKLLLAEIAMREKQEKMTSQ